MATFDTGIGVDHQFTFVNHSNTPIHYNLKQATGGDQQEIRGKVGPGKMVESTSFDYSSSTLEQGNVPVIRIDNTSAPNFRFWSGSDGDINNI